ncbi:MAG: lipopolysaccharide heptosyltransferase II [bacterium]
MHTRPKKILIVQTAFIGDVILATPLAAAAHEVFGPSAVHFMAIPAAVNLLERNPQIQRIWVYDKRGRQRGLRAWWQLAQEIRQERFDLALVPHRSLRSAALVRMANIPRRIGFDRSAGAPLFTDRVRYTAKHEVERNLDLLRPFGEISSSLKPSVYWDEADAARVAPLLDASPPSRRKLALAPGSVWATKRWPEDRFASLACRLIAECNAEVYLIGGREDVALCQSVQRRCGAHCHNAAGILTLRQSAALLDQCELLISNDSAPTHLGVATRCRVLCIFGPTAPRFGFAPYGPGHDVIEKELPCRPCSAHGSPKCPLGTHACMLELSIDQVLARAARMLELRGRAPAGMLQGLTARE